MLRKNSFAYDTLPRRNDLYISIWRYQWVEISGKVEVIKSGKHQTNGFIQGVYSKFEFINNICKNYVFGFYLFWYLFDFLKNIFRVH